MRNILTILILFLLTNICIGQSSLTFSIEQIELTSLDFCQYNFDGRKLIVTENNKRIEKRKLDQYEIKQIDSVIRYIELGSIKDSYSRALLGGVDRIFTFNINGKVKEVRLSNYYLKKLDVFLNKVNSFLEEKNRVISFGEDMLSRSDTIIYYLPDFFIDTFDIPEHYDSYGIMCFRKGYFYTEILDSIHLCECRIYPTDKNGHNKKRKYWKAIRLDINSWRRDFFNNENQKFKTEYLQDILPYHIVEEKITLELGVKPTFEIYRYYKTKIKIE